MEGDLDMTGEINWDNLFLDLDFPDCENILEISTSVTLPSQPLSNPFPDGDAAVVSSRIGEIEKVLMEDEPLDDRAEIQPVPDDFFADILVDSPVSGSGEVTDDAPSSKQNHTIDKDDPVAKKQRRMLRNRDAAVRSRERKKMYIKDLELKSKYLEGECRRLSRMLQCFITENQALRLTLHNKGCAFDASSAKQESAVLLLESLLLGSLLWLVGIVIMCPFTLPTLLEAVPLENEEKRDPEGVAPRGSGNNVVGVGLSFLKSRRCKASRAKIKEFHVFGILSGVVLVVHFST